MFRAEFGFIFCSSRNVLRISLEEIGKSGQNRVFISLVGFGSGFGQQGSGSGRVEKLRPDSNSALLWDQYLPDIFSVTFLNLEQCLAKHRNT